MTEQPQKATPFDLEATELASMDQVLDSLTEQSDIEKGAMVDAKVVYSDERDVFLDIGQKQDGRCPLAEFDERPTSGSTVPVVVLDESADGMIRLSRARALRRASWDRLSEAFQAGHQLSGQVSKVLPQGYLVAHGGVDLFLPLSQSDVKIKGRRLSPGQSIDFKILELKDKHRSAIISRKVIIEARNEEKWNEFQAQYKVGDDVTGKVSKIVSFGVFLDLGGLEGLLHQSDISWKKFAPFKDRFKTGEELTVRILGMDRDNNRISLGLKQLTEDPWEWARNNLEPETVIKGRVINLTDYGAFLEIKEGLEGLVHVSELTWARRVRHPKRYLQLDQEVEAMVLGVDFESKRVSLGIRQLTENPWEKLSEEVEVGDVIEGPVTRVTKFGAFVTVRPDVEALIHFSDYSWADKTDREMLKKGDVVKFKILEINSEDRRVSAGIKQLSPSPHEELRKKYKNGDVIDCKIKNVADFGLFVEFEGFEGLIHRSKINLKGDDVKLEDHFKPGDPLKAALLNINVPGRKISLSIKDYERKQEREIINQYLKKDDSPSTSSLGDLLKNKL